MALSEKSRSELYQALEGLAGPEAVEEMLSHFPARDVEEPVTREHLDRRFAEVQTSMAELRTEMNRLHNRLLIEVTAVVGVVAALLRLSLV